MIKFLYGFTIFLLSYFVIYVTGTYLLAGIPYAGYVFPILKESAWFIFVGYCLWQARSNIHSYLLKTQREVLLLLSIALWGIVATMIEHGIHGSTIINIMIGLKYGLYSSIIFYTAARVGYSSPLTQSDIINYIKRLAHILVWFCGLGIVWQGIKRMNPDLFYNILGYGPLGDYHLGQPHPIYYRTGPGGYPRLSGLMSGPNNLGYLLVAYASIIPLYIRQGWMRLLFYSTTLLTLSRAALLGSGIQGALYGIKYLARRSRMLLVGGIILGITAVGVLSIIKGSSTLEHLTRTWGAIQSVIDNPRGVGLGSSGPGVHRNGSVLPENFYLQLLIDYGTIPFIGRCVYRYYIIHKTRLMMNHHGDVVAKPLRAYIAGLLGLFIVGLFLHVFEDSVVNYLFFVPFGLLWGYCLRGLPVKGFAK